MDKKTITTIFVLNNLFICDTVNNRNNIIFKKFQKLFSGVINIISYVFIGTKVIGCLNV